jgi:hypothetical protein
MLEVGRRIEESGSEPVTNEPGSRVGIHEHNITKRLKSFALCYSQLLLLADFRPLYGFLRLEFSTATAVRGGEDLALCLFTFKTTILIYLVSVYFLFR